MDEPVFGRDRSGLHGLSTSSSHSSHSSSTHHNNSINMDGSLMSKDDKHTLHGLLINMHTCLSEHSGVNALFQLTSSLYTADITHNSTAAAAAVSRATAMLSKKIHATTSDTDRRKWHDVTRMEMLVKLFYQPPSDPSSTHHSSAASLKRSTQPYDAIPSCTCHIHPTSCPIRLYRCFFAVRGPDNLIRMLKHIISTTAIINELDPNDVIQEWTWKMIWRCDQILRSGVLDTCDGPLTLSEKAKEKQHFMPWWYGGMLQKVLKIIAKLGPFSESVINVFVELLTGDLILPEDVTINGTSRQPKSAPTTRATTTQASSQSRFKIKPIVESAILPALLFALSTTSPSLCKSGLEYLNVLLIRHPENARHFLIENQWQQWIVPLLTDVGGPPAGVSISGIIGPHSVFRPLQKQSNTISGVSPVLDDDGDSSLSQESKLAMNLMVCILYYQFACDHIIDDVHGDESMFKVLIESVDLIEDMNGWNAQTVGLIRLMFSSLTSKISSNLNNRNSFRHEFLHRSWDCLFDYLACVEDFIFYSPLQSSSTSSTPANRSPAHTPTHSPTAATRTLSHMTLDDKHHSLTSGSSSGSMQGTPAKAARAQEARHFKTVGLHTNATGTSEDIQLVEKVVTLLEGLKIQEVSATPDVYQDLAEREKVKKTKKRVQAEIAFFKEIAGFLRNSNTLKFRESPQSQVNHMIKSITNALESRKRLRGEVSGVFHNLTRSKRLRSLESKLSGQSEKGNTATVTKTKDRVELGVEKFDLRSKLERARRAFRNPKSAKDYYESRSMAIDSTPIPQNNQPPPATRDRDRDRGGVPSHLPKKLSSNDLNAMKNNDIPKKTSHPSASSPTATPLAILTSSEPSKSTPTPTPTSTAPTRPALHLVIKAPTHAPPPPPTDDNTPPPPSPQRHATPPLHSSAHNSPRHASPQRFTPPIHSSIPSPPIGGNFSSGFPSPMLKSHAGTTPPSLHPSPLKTSTSSSSLDETSVTCTHCHIPLQDSFEYEGRPYCERDFARLFCSCGICNQIVENDQPYVRLAMSSTTSSTAHTRSNSEKQLYHIKCLTCTHCSRPLGNTDDEDELLDMLDLDQDRKGVYQYDNKVYCRVDCYALFGARCPYCSQLVTGEKLEALGESWHPHHFICAGPCGRSLENRDFYMVPDKKNSSAASTQANSFKITKDTNISSSLHPRNHTNGRESSADKAHLRPFCEKCFLSQYKLCSGCGETVNSDLDGIQVAMGDKKLPYHHHCYVCSVCNSGKTSPTTTPRGNDGKVGARFGGGLSTSTKLLFGPDEKLYCQDHFIHKFASLCPACQHRVIDDDVCVVNEHEYHVACVTCTVCNISLTTSGQQVFVKEDMEGNAKLYCRTHYQDLLTPVVEKGEKGPTCKRCSKALTGDCVVISGHNYHSACVLCSVCDKPLSVPLGGDGKIYSQSSDELRGKDESQHGLIYCHEHYLSLFASSCPQCEKYVTGGQVLKMKNQISCSLFPLYYMFYTIYCNI